MKKYLLSLLAVLILLCCSSVVLAQGKGKPKDAGTKDEQTQKLKDSQPASAKVEDEALKSDVDRKRARDTYKTKDVVKEEPKQIKPVPGKEKAKAQSEVKPGSELKGAPKPAAKGKDAEKLTARGKEHQQQLRAIEKQLLHEEAKHRERTARLARIRQLAVEQGKTEIVKRVDQLIQKEQKLNGRRGQRLQKMKQMISQPETKRPTEQTKKDVEVKRRPAEDKKDKKELEETARKTRGKPEKTTETQEKPKQ